MFSGKIDTSVKKEVLTAESKLKIIMQIDNPVMIADGEKIKIDENDTVPVITNGRTLVPVWVCKVIVKKLHDNCQKYGQ